MAIKIPGVIPFLTAMDFMQWAASVAIRLSNWRLSQKKSHNSDGMVKVMCCQAVRGST